MRDSQAWDFPGPHVIEVDVTDALIDDLGHTNNVHYLAWLQRCAWSHSRAVGLGMAEYRELGHAMAVLETRMRYLAPTYAGDRLLVGDWITRCNRLRATRTFQVVHADTGNTVMRAEIEYVCIDLDSGRPARMPAAFVEAYRVEAATAT